MARTFKIVMRGPSALVFPETQGLRIDAFPSTTGRLNVIYASRWISNSEGVRIPGDLWVEVEGVGENLEAVLTPFANAGISVLPVLALAFNASIHETDLEVGFETTPDAAERDYFQAYISPERTVAHVSRLGRPELAFAVIEAMFKHPDRERLLRAANQYRLALESWKLGREGLSLAHLWMATEALTEVQVRQLMAQQAISTRGELAQSLGVTDPRQFEPTIRRKYILKGDDECYAKARKASDGFEHGYLGHEVIRSHAEAVRHRLAGYVRACIFHLADIPAESVERLLRAPYDKPVGHWPLAKYLRGTLHGKVDQLAAAGSAYPFVKWNPVVTACALGPDGQITMTTRETFTAELGDGAAFTQRSYEVLEPGKLSVWWIAAAKCFWSSGDSCTLMRRLPSPHHPP